MALKLTTLNSHGGAHASDPFCGCCRLIGLLFSFNIFHQGRWRPSINLLSVPFSASVVKAVVSPRPFQYAGVSPPPIHLKLCGLRSRYAL
jgi:hypothetical protein